MTAPDRPTALLEDVDMEDALLGTLITNPARIPDAAEVLTLADFSRPSRAHTWAALVALHAGGHGITSRIVLDECRRQGHDPGADIVHMVGQAGPGSSWRRYADALTRATLRRKLLAEAAELVQVAKDPLVDPAEALDRHVATMRSIETPLLANEPDDVSVEEFVARGKRTPAPWLIHGLIRMHWRIVFVATPGKGKTTLFRQILVASAYGLHPFRPDQSQRPLRVLSIDFENPEDQVWEGFDDLLRRAQKTLRKADVEPVNRLWHHPEGIDLRTRSGIAAFENVLRARRPELVALSPLYRAWTSKASEGWDGPALELQNTLNRLRIQYGFALIVEDHPPQASAGAKNPPMRPYGSVLWTRWPELGFGLVPVDKRWRGGQIGDQLRLDSSQFRDDRVGNDWPDIIERERHPWPWGGVWTEGMPPVSNGDEPPYDEEPF